MRSTLLALFAVLGASCGGGAPRSAPPPNASRSAAIDAAPVDHTCRASTAFVTSLRQKMTVDAYVTHGLPRLDAFVRSLQGTLARYKSAAPDRFDYRVVVADSPERKTAATDAGLREEVLGEAGDKDSAQLRKGFMGLVFVYGAERVAIPYLPPDRADGVEFWITSKMRELVARVERSVRRIGVLAGHGEISLREPNLIPATLGSPTIAQIMEVNFPFYELTDVELHESVPDWVDGLVITQPKRDLTDAELRRIDDFVMSGRPLAVFASAVNLAPGDPSMMVTYGAHGLERVLGGYGITMRKDVVLDFARSFNVLVKTQNGDVTARFPQLPDVEEDERLTGEERLLDASSPVFFRLTSLSFPYASSLAIEPATQPEARVRVLARSTPRAIADTRVGDLRLFRSWKPKGTPTQVPLAAVAEGTLRSAFTRDRRSAPRARVLVVSSSQFLANPFARAGNPDPGSGAIGDEQALTLAGPYATQSLANTILAFKNTLDWMTLPDELAGCASIELF